MPTSDWAVTVADVAALLRARTKTQGGIEAGTFTGDTRPTDVQVVDLIDGAVGDLATEIGTDIREDYWPAARRLAALGAALEVELSYYPEQVGTGRSPYPQMKVLYDDRLKRLVKSMSEAPNDEGGIDAGGAGSPSYAFPEDAGGMIGWGTRW